MSHKSNTSPTSNGGPVPMERSATSSSSSSSSTTLPPPPPALLPPQQHHPRRAVQQAHNPTPHVIPEGDNATPLEVVGGTAASDKLVIVMVGLPATGKTHMAKRICRFLTFFHDIPAEIFNVGDVRRRLVGAQMPASFYHPTNQEGLKMRTMACEQALADLVQFLQNDEDASMENSLAKVAVYDATNSTKERRRHILQTLDRANVGAKRMFIESICDDEQLLEDNIRKVKLSTPDYRGMDPVKALADFKERRANYMSVYETLDDEDGSYLKVLNCSKFIINDIRGYLPLKVVHFVMNLHTLQRTFYLTRHGQSEYNLLGKIGGDSGLTPAGWTYARRLAEYAREEIAQHDVWRQDAEGNAVRVREPRPARLWTSTLRRTKETAHFIAHPEETFEWDNGDKATWVQFRPRARRNLDEIYAGICDGMTYKEIEVVYPDEFARRQLDKLKYRYPRGESYMDVTLRLEPLAHEMERSREPILIVGHQGILRILYAYFMGQARHEAPYVSIPLNTIIKLSPHAYGCHEERICLMKKEEMLLKKNADGQDEPLPTSMPTAPTKRTTTTTTTTMDDTFTTTTTTLSDGADPVMDPISH